MPIHRIGQLILRQLVRMPIYRRFRSYSPAKSAHSTLAGMPSLLPHSRRMFISILSWWISLETTSAGWISLNRGRLQWIDLSWNKLDFLSENAFRDLPLLQHLNLSHNKISHIDAATFLPVLRIMTLDLSNNSLSGK